MKNLKPLPKSILNWSINSMTKFESLLPDFEKAIKRLADKRNLTVHTYKEAVAEEVFAILPKALEHFQKLDQRLRQGQGCASI